MVHAQWGANEKDQALLLAVFNIGWAHAHLNGDEAVDAADLAPLIARFGYTTARDLTGDVNGDWIADLIDQALLTANWNIESRGHSPLLPAIVLIVSPHSPIGECDTKIGLISIDYLTYLIHDSENARNAVLLCIGPRICG